MLLLVNGPAKMPNINSNAQYDQYGYRLLQAQSSDQAQIRHGQFIDSEVDYAHRHNLHSLTSDQEIRQATGEIEGFYDEMRGVLNIDSSGPFINYTSNSMQHGLPHRSRWIPLRLPPVESCAPPSNRPVASTSFFDPVHDAYGLNTGRDTPAFSPYSRKSGIKPRGKSTNERQRPGLKAPSYTTPDGRQHELTDEAVAM